MPDTDELDQMSGDDDADAVDVAEVYEETEESEGPRKVWVAQVEIRGDGHIDILEVGPNRENFLRNVILRANEKEEIELPSDEPGNEPYTTRFTSVARGGPAFIPALRTFLETYYGLHFV
jgi:hypothetical protein